MHLPTGYLFNGPSLQGINPSCGTKLNNKFVFSIRPGSHWSEFCLSKHLICQHIMKNKCDPILKTLPNFLPIAKILPMFKEAEVLPRRLPNFGKVDNFVYLTIKLSFTPFTYLKIARADDFFLHPLSSLSLAIILMCHEFCILSCDKFKPST